ncbi:MAG TPA: hypothetical protein VJ417_06180 [Candidatus Glassbacteria bacterium]|nr:hypothetical protein [Candidatus Glassbacteria bacterium]
MPNATGKLFIITSIFTVLLTLACGDDQITSLPGTGSVQGVWEGTMSLTSTGGDLSQTSKIRLELVQRDFSFEGLMLKIDPLAEGFGRSPVDTFLVAGGTLSGQYVSFNGLEASGGSALLEGTLGDRLITGSVIGSGYSGQWSVNFIF